MKISVLCVISVGLFLTVGDVYKKAMLWQGNRTYDALVEFNSIGFLVTLLSYITFLKIAASRSVFTANKMPRYCRDHRAMHSKFRYIEVYSGVARFSLR